MNMKKTVAGLAAGVVALSAMAATVSAKNEITYTEAQKAATYTKNFASNKYKVEWSKSVEAVNTFSGSASTTAGSAAGKGFTFANASGASYQIVFAAASAATAITAVNSGNGVITITPSDGTDDTAATLQTALQTINAQLTVTGTYDAATAITDSTLEAQVTTTASAITVAPTDAQNIDFVFDDAGTLPDSVTVELKGYLRATTTASTTTATLSTVTKTLKNTTTTADTTAGKKRFTLDVVAPGTLLTEDNQIDLSLFRTEANDFISTKVTATVKDESKVVDTEAKSLATDSTKHKTYKLTTVEATGTAGSLANLIAGVAATEQTFTTGDGTVATDTTAAHGFTISGYGFETTNDAYSATSSSVAMARLYNMGGVQTEETTALGKVTAVGNADATRSVDGSYYVTDKGKVAADIKRNVTAFNIKNMRAWIQSTIGDAKGATITFGIYVASSSDTKVDSFDAGTVASLSSTGTAMDLSLAVNTANSTKYYAGASAADNKITFNWDDVTQGLAAGTISDMFLRVASGKTFTIDSITVDVPAKTLEDLAAGESVADSASSIAAPETSATEATTAAAANPTTGNAPIALAVIPVAIIAAAVIAKKRG